NTQVGRGFFTNGSHALVWHGSADSVVDLHPFLAGLAISFVSSEAIGVAANGDVVGIANGLSNPTNYAVKWTLVPEPRAGAGLSGAVVVAAMVARRGERRHLPA